ncbi:MAG: crossover junction endodeoxyribonuclease RuvC [Candidatus Berkelbacteria bacterium]|nr:crossover junction endodeoxyribonuclease RuvC [Candidatus Berkelbacteria bacterium]
MKPLQSRTILGIDPGTGRCGWAIIKSPSPSPQFPELVDCGCIETKANTSLPERLELIYKTVCDLIEKYHPTDLAIEELFFVKNIKTGISVSQARGVVILAAKQAKIPIFEYKPNEIKLAITGYGHATKEQMAKMIKLHLKGCNIKQDDTVDAAAVALHHLQISKLKM